jgi:hypothetical protein
MVRASTVSSERGDFLRREVLERDLSLPPTRAVIVASAMESNPGQPQGPRAWFAGSASHPLYFGPSGIRQWAAE